MDKLEYAKWLATLKHGKHNQLRHGYRYGKAPKLAHARRLRKAGLWGDYKGRSRGTIPRKGKPKPKTKPKNEEVKKAKNKLNEVASRYISDPRAKASLLQIAENASDKEIHDTYQWLKDEHMAFIGRDGKTSFSSYSSEPRNWLHSNSGVKMFGSYGDSVKGTISRTRETIKRAKERLNSLKSTKRPKKSDIYYLNSVIERESKDLEYWEKKLRILEKAGRA